MSGVELDVTDLLAAADDFRAAAAGLISNVVPVVAETAAEIRGTMRTDMAESAHFGQVARHIGYNTRLRADGVEAQIGPDAVKAGKLANIAYFGGVNGGGGTVRDPLDAAEMSRSAFDAALSRVIDGLL